MATMDFPGRSYFRKLLGLPDRASDKEYIMHVPIRRLGLGREFNRKCRVMGFRTLHEVTLIEPMKLVEMDGFDYNWLADLAKFLSERKLLHLLQPLPGKGRR